jgi:hypothetical protein
MSYNSLGITSEELTEAAAATGTELPVLPDTFIPTQDEEHTVQEVSFETQQVVDSARNSLDFLAALAMPSIYKYTFPPVFLSVWTWLLTYIEKKRDFSQLALGLPRGFGKTMVLKLFVLYCILFTDRKFILVVCETTGKAINIISDVMDMLDEQNIKTVFGDWRLGIETDKQDLKKFGFRGRNIILMAAGAESGIRGITLKNVRPDVMVFDDIQSRSCADSQTQSDILERELIGTAMKSKSPHGCLFIFIANMYPTKWSLLRKLKGNPNWIKFIAGGILSDGTSLWEDLQPLEQLMKEFANDLSMGHPEIFYAEVMNDENASSNNLIDLSKLPPFPYDPVTDIPVGNFIIIDPSNDKANSDAVSIGYFEVYEGLPILQELIEDRLSPGDTIRKTLEIALRKNCRLIVVESNAYQYSLNYWFRFICQQLGIEGIEAVEIYSGSMAKNSRILQMFKSLLAGEVFISKECQAPCYLQISQFNPLKRDNTDGLLDLLTYAPRVLEMYGEYVQSMNVVQQQDFGSIKVLTEIETSSF